MSMCDIHEKIIFFRKKGRKSYQLNCPILLISSSHNNLLYQSARDEDKKESVFSNDRKEIYEVF